MKVWLYIVAQARFFQNTLQTVFNGISKYQWWHHRFWSNLKWFWWSIRKCLTNYQRVQFKIYISKIKLHQKQLEFFGYVFSDQGIFFSSRTIDAIKDASVHKNASEVRSFLGMVWYCRRLTTNLAVTSVPLRVLRRKDVKWTWISCEQHVFDIPKDLLPTDTVVGYLIIYKYWESALSNWKSTWNCFCSWSLSSVFVWP